MPPFPGCQGQAIVTRAYVSVLGSDISVLLRLLHAGEQKAVAIRCFGSEMFGQFQKFNAEG